MPQCCIVATLGGVVKIGTAARCMQGAGAPASLDFGGPARCWVFGAIGSRRPRRRPCSVRAAGESGGAVQGGRQDGHLAGVAGDGLYRSRRSRTAGLAPWGSAPAPGSHRPPRRGAGRDKPGDRPVVVGVKGGARRWGTKRAPRQSAVDLWGFACAPTSPCRIREQAAIGHTD